MFNDKKLLRFLQLKKPVNIGTPILNGVFFCRKFYDEKILRDLFSDKKMLR
ncbi:hypothetical protein HMPREF0083_00230 [Aneurinibacillus aneurinilyticus ATCC 12856]|uniref:Uncharacterized protein n=1 Tax=Aneurinibacillus aneurinilyticus ATCC 12856 TaxID=649747 RepID=U1X9R2_ANEAE|nr:hypothetical protein HMPREF0083_00230 [Aneurinibacillus aneurinilyticus ATCC 12856]